MSNLEKYNKVFAEVFSVEESQLNNGFSHETVAAWDSVHQLSLVTGMEESFDIMFDTEDILDFTSYEKGRELLKKYEVEV